MAEKYLDGYIIGKVCAASSYAFKVNTVHYLSKATVAILGIHKSTVLKPPQNNIGTYTILTYEHGWVTEAVDLFGFIYRKTATTTPRSARSQEIQT